MVYPPGQPCPCKNCDGVLVGEDDHVICPDCGYCPEEDFDPRIKDCPLCESFCYIINQGNIVCSGCSLELTADTEEMALGLWNKIPRKESN